MFINEGREFSGRRNAFASLFLSAQLPTRAGPKIEDYVLAMNLIEQKS